jgi:pimeloyl-ACP methyl ester carboxylesterase
VKREHLIPRSTGFVSVDGEQIYYETAGDPRPEALVFCHGLGGNHASWYQQVPRFAAEYFVITWDQRGFGRSTNHGGQASPVAGTRDLGHLLDELRIERAHLVGQSMSGWVALGFALQQRERTLSLTLTETIAGIYTPETERAFDQVLREASVGAGTRGELPLGIHPALGRTLLAQDPDKAFLYQQLTSLGPSPPAEIRARLRATGYPLKDVGTLQMAVLFIVGSDDPIFPPKVIEVTAAQLRDSRLVVIPETGHSPYFESAGPWNDALADFLRSASRPSR